MQHIEKANVKMEILLEVAENGSWAYLDSDYEYSCDSDEFSNEYQLLESIYAIIPEILEASTGEYLAQIEAVLRFNDDKLDRTQTKWLRFGVKPFTGYEKF